MGSLCRLKMVVAYDGRPFHGFAENAGVPTVAATLRGALERVLRAEVDLTGAGRTDSGVHAWGQVVSFDAPADGLDLARLQRSANGLCGPAIVVRSAEVVPPDFDARFSARWRRYRYRILNRAVPDPFLASTTWHVEDPLDVSLLTLACDPLIGEHDFGSFCRRRRGAAEGEPQSLVRRVLDARWTTPEPDIVQFEIRATAFCHQMVRSIVGLLVDVGHGKRTPGDVMDVLRARDRSRAGQLAPPHGLCLWDVGYDE
jgi:tRNA pseudouridine38-40 synthase